MNPLTCLLVLTFAASVGGGDSQRVHPLETIMQDDALLLHRDPASVRNTVRRMKALGVDRVRITAGWSELAPSPTRKRRPRFDATNSLEYPERPWRELDTAVKEVRSQGMQVMLDVAFFAPRWAVRRGMRGQRQRWRPKWQEFGQFALAVARRYSGGWPDPGDPQQKLPVVRMWTTWNEPNHPVFLMPQWKPGPNGTRLAASPHIYRNLHNAAYGAIKSVDQRNRVLVGGLASDAGANGKGIAPLRFVRELACVDAKLEPLKRKACKDYTPLRADGFAHHPYTLGTAPDASDPDPDDVKLRDLDRLSTLLRRLYQRGRIARELPLYVTEYGYETNPPDPKRGISPQQQARYIGLSTFMAWRNPDLRSFAQFLLRDIPPPPGSAGGDYQTGLEYPDGRDKPAAQAFKLPIWAEVRGFRGSKVPRVFIFGQVRPGQGKRRRASVEVRDPKGVWREVYSLPSDTRFARTCTRGAGSFFTEGQGFFLRSVPFLGRRTTYRFRWFLGKKDGKYVSELSPTITVP